MALNFVVPVIKNGRKVALVNEADVASEVRRWENAVVAYFVGHDSIHSPSSFSKSIDNLIVSEWRKYGDVKVYSQGSGVFVLDFKTAQGKELALAEGPRFYDGSKPLIFKPWSPDLSLEIEELKSAPIWIKLPNLRLHLWSPEALSKIASLLGRPLFTDTITASRKTTSYARICVEVEFDKVLPDSVTIEDDKGCSYSQKVEYEWKPTSRCSHCLHIGHSDSCQRGETTSSCLWCKKSDPHHFCCKQSWPGRAGFGTTGAPGADPTAYGAGTSFSPPAFGSTPGASSSTRAVGSISAPPVGSTPFSITAPEPFGATISSTSAFGSTPGASSSTPAFGSISAPLFGSTSSTSSSSPSAFGSLYASGFGSTSGTSSSSASAFGSISASGFGSTSCTFSSAPGFGATSYTTSCTF